MGFLNFFKKKKKTTPPVIRTIKKVVLIPNTFTTVSKGQYEEEIKKYFDLEKYGFGLEENQKIQIYLGDLINNFGELNKSEHLLVIGNINTEWVNLTKNNYNDSGGSLFVTGNILADYFSGDFGKFILINGSLTARKILNIEFQNSLLDIGGDLTTEYFHGIDIWAEVGGRIKIEYGDGYCINAEGKPILPKNDIETSLDFLKINEHDRDSTKINEIIKNDC